MNLNILSTGVLSDIIKILAPKKPEVKEQKTPKPEKLKASKEPKSEKSKQKQKRKSEESKGNGSYSFSKT